MKVNWKLASAFATGAVLASGIVYFAVKPVDAPRVDVPKPAVAAKTVAPPAPEPTPVAQIPVIHRAPGSRKAITHAATGAASKGSRDRPQRPTAAAAACRTATASAASARARSSSRRRASSAARPGPRFGARARGKCFATGAECRSPRSKYSNSRGGCIAAGSHRRNAFVGAQSAR